MLHETIKNLHQEELNVETVAPTLLLDKNGLRPFFQKQSFFSPDQQNLGIAFLMYLELFQISSSLCNKS